MKELLYKVIGRSSLCLDLLRPSPRSGTANRDGIHYDKTGIVVSDMQPLEILWKDPEVIYVQYDSFAHSFWRAQEFTLFEMHRRYLHRPLLDFGCGDGSFASVLFKEIEYGVDNDQEALSMAGKFGIYKQLICPTQESIPLGDSSVQSVLSNSVLEHVTNPDGALSEIYRILVKNGTFMFTVPVDRFKHDLATYFGKEESERINSEYYHRNLFAAEDWVKLLEHHGFSMITMIQYQPAWFTFWYRMFRIFGSRGLGRIYPGIGKSIWEHHKTALTRMVKKSISETEQGANIFVITRKLENEPACINT